MPEVRRVNEKEIKFEVGYHEWAWSIRTSGMPVGAIINSPDGYKEIDIGRTSKKPTAYFVPANAVVVVRYYSIKNGAEIAVVDEKNNFQPEYYLDVAPEERQAIEWWLSKRGYD